MVYTMSGINLGDQKRELLKARLAKRLRALRLSDIRAYMDFLRNDSSGQEIVNFLDVITTNKTDFFREPQHFDFLSQDILPSLDRLCGAGGDFRLWSAACSSGEEPYTLSIVLLENRAMLGRRKVNIHASDLSTKVLGNAERGVYAAERVAGIPRNILTKYFQKGQNRWQGYVRVRPELRSLVQYSRINLMDRFSFDQPFHVIFCRNVMIYFDKITQQRLVEKFWHALVGGGYVFVGHSESLAGIKHDFKFIRPAIYRKGA
jgi:chemotaxis protein methyltransferase CheR